MEFVTGYKVSSNSVSECKTFLLQEVLPKLKEKNYVHVHGDLQLLNLMKCGGRFLVLDYDWASLEGTVCFPLDLNTKLKWPRSVVPGGFITRKIDEEIVNSLEKLV